MTTHHAKSNEAREFWIRTEGISKPCTLHAAVYTKQDLEAEGGSNEFIEEGVHVIEYHAYEKVCQELKSYKDHLELFEASIRHSFKEREDKLLAKCAKYEAALRLIENEMCAGDVCSQMWYQDVAKEALE